MPQIVENWSDIEGRLQDNNPSNTPGFTILEIRVASVTPVAGFPNLLEDAAGTTIKVNAPDQLVQGLDLSKGATVRCRVRRAGPKNIFVHPEHLSIVN